MWLDYVSLKANYFTHKLCQANFPKGMPASCLCFPAKQGPCLSAGGNGILSLIQTPGISHPDQITHVFIRISISQPTGNYFQRQAECPVSETFLDILASTCEFTGKLHSVKWKKCGSTKSRTGWTGRDFRDCLRQASHFMKDTWGSQKRDW